MRTHVAVSAIALLISLVGAAEIDSYIPCMATENCTNISSLPQETTCEEGYCMCPNDEEQLVRCSTQTSIHQTRTPGLLLNRTCKVNRDCFSEQFKGAICNTTNSQCMCSKDYVPSSHKRHCVPKIQTINSTCTEDNQCLAHLPNTICHPNNKCNCTSDYHYINGACWKTVEYGKHCTKDEECSPIEGVICKNSICECNANTVLNKERKKCLAAAQNIRDKCTESVQCKKIQHSFCIENICQCSEDYHYEHNMTNCIVNKKIDDECTDNYECYQAEDYKSDPPTKSLICKDNKCICAENYTREDNICVDSGSVIFVPFPIIALIMLSYIIL